MRVALKYREGSVPIDGMNGGKVLVFMTQIHKKELDVLYSQEKKS